MTEFPFCLTTSKRQDHTLYKGHSNLANLKFLNRAESEKKSLVSTKSPALDKKPAERPERKVLTKENKEPKEAKETKSNSIPPKEDKKDEKEKKEDVKEKETPKVNRLKYLLCFVLLWSSRNLGAVALCIY